MSFVRYFKDTLQNFVSGLGMQGVDPSKSVQYILSLLDRNTLDNMYRGDWLARKICDQPADDITREWRSWQASQQQIESIETVEKTLDLQRKVKQWIIKARLYGGGALIIGADDGNQPDQPLDLEKCGKGCLKYVVVLHRWELNAGPRIYNVMDPYYTRAAYYTVATPMFGFMGEPGTVMPSIPGQPPLPPPGALRPQSQNVVSFKSGGKTMTMPSTVPTNIGLTQIHPSRVIELPGNELPDWRLAPLGGGWGDSVLQTVVDVMNSFTQTYSSISALVSDAKLDVVKIPDMTTNLTEQKYKDRLIERFALSAQTKSVISALLLDKEEEWERVNTPFSGLDMILHEFLTLIAGAANIPVSILFGQAYGKGLQGGSTGGGADDVRSYYDMCATIQKNDIGPRMGILDQVLMRSALGKADPNINYVWNPLWQLSDDDKSKIALAKAQSTQIYATIGIINQDALREGVVNQLIEDGTYPGFDDAIEEYGSEPEEPVDAGGYGGPMNGGGGGYGQEPAEPAPEDIGASGKMGDAWTEEAREASALARKRMEHWKERIAHHERKARQHPEGSHKRAMHAMAAQSYREAVREASRRGGDPEVAHLHAAVARHMMDEAAGHVFHGNQHTGGIGGAEASHAAKVKAFISSPQSQSIIRSTLHELAHMTEHFVKHESELLVSSTIGASLVALGSPVAPAAAAGMVAGYAIHRLAPHLGISREGAHKLLQMCVNRLDHALSHVTGMHALSHAAGMDAEEDSLHRSLRRLNYALSHYTTEQLTQHVTHDFDPNEPRDPQGKWTTGGGGSKEGDHPGEGYSKEAKVDEKGVIHTTNVDDAVQALREGRKVELNQPREVATLLDKLGKVASDMIAKGEKAPNFDLCKVSVKGTNLFCAEGLGIKREDMPQLPDDTSGFVRYLRKSGYSIKPEEELASHLRATQNQLKGAQVAGMAKFIETGINKEGKSDPEGRRKLMNRAILISRDGYILDGHHNWAANIGVAARNGTLESGTKMKVLRVNTSITNLLYLGEDYTGGKGHKGVDRRWFDYNPDQPRAASAPGHSSGEFAAFGRAGIGGGEPAREIVGYGGGIGSGAQEGIGYATGGRTEPPGGAKASPLVPDKLVQAIEDHVIGVAGEVGKKGAADLSEWLMRTHRDEILKIADATKDDFVLLHKGDAKVGMPTVWLLMWSKSYSTSIHDHLESEVGVSVLRGKVGNRVYESPSGYLDRAKSADGLEAKIGDKILGTNQTIQLKAPYIHQMYGTSEPGQKRDVTVHAYAPPLAQMHYFKPDSRGHLHYAGDWDESRVPEDFEVRRSWDAMRFFGCPCCMGGSKKKSRQIDSSSSIGFLDFDPDQARDPHGRWTFAGGPHGESWQKLAGEVRNQVLAGRKSMQVESTKLRQNLNTAMRELEQFQDAKDWYDRHRPLAKELFGENEPLFEKFLAATSPGMRGDQNMREALRAMQHHMLGKQFDDSYRVVGRYPAGTLANLQRIQRGEELRGDKVPDFHRALIGDPSAVPGDIWMGRLMFKQQHEAALSPPEKNEAGFYKSKTGGLSAGQHKILTAVVTAFADKMGWQPRQMQAALWATEIARQEYGANGKPWDYQQYLSKRAAGIRALIKNKWVGKVEDALSELEQLARAYEDGAALFALIGAIHAHVPDPTEENVLALLHDEAAGHPFRGNQYVSGESGSESLKYGEEGMPKSWGELSGKQQERVEREWRDENYKKELDYEIEQWHNSGEALIEAKNQVADSWNSERGNRGDYWADEALADARDWWKENRDEEIPYTDDQLRKAISIEETAYNKWEVKFDDKKLQEPSDKPEPHDPRQLELPGTPPATTPDYSSHLTGDVREHLKEQITEAFNNRADFISGDLEPPDFSESVNETLDQIWNEMSEDEKFTWAQKNTDIVEPPVSPKPSRYHTGMPSAEFTAHVKDLVKKVADPRIVNDFKFDDHTGLQMTRAGMIQPYASTSRKDNKITIYVRNNQDQSDKHIEGTIAHESMHHKFNDVMKDDLKELSEFESKENKEKLIREMFDHPVSDYAMSHWVDASSSPSGDAIFVAIHETLAEIARREHQEGKVPEGVPTWKHFYDTVNSLWEKRHARS